MAHELWMPEGGIIIEVNLTRISEKTTNPDPSLSIDLASSHFPVRLRSCQCGIGPHAHYLGMSPLPDQYGRAGLIQTFLIIQQYDKIYPRYKWIPENRKNETLIHDGSPIPVRFFHSIIYEVLFADETITLISLMLILLQS